jgi:putative PIN family toxin of toxin-antitoxin system
VVLDTNVLLSLFVFADSRFAAIRRSLEDGCWQALTDERCLAEFRLVIARPMFGLDEAGQAAALAAYTGLARQVVAPPGDPAVLPLCKDREDQKFLELARDGRADWLVTSDKALLRLARRGRLRHLFAIVTPEQAVAP